MNFSSLDLAPVLQQAIDACGYKKMTPIQQQAIVVARRGRDVLASAQTGTGKTAAFAVPILQQMLNKPKKTTPGTPRALILTPTRELAEQLATNIANYAQFTDISVTALYGGVTKALCLYRSVLQLYRTFVQKRVRVAVCFSFKPISQEQF